MKTLADFLTWIRGKAVTLQDQVEAAGAEVLRLQPFEALVTDLQAKLAAAPTAADLTKAATDLAGAQAQFQTLSAEHQKLKDNFDARVRDGVNTQLTALGHAPLALGGTEGASATANEFEQYLNETDPAKKAKLWATHKSTIIAQGQAAAKGK